LNGARQGVPAPALPADEVAEAQDAHHDDRASAPEAAACTPWRLAVLFELRQAAPFAAMSRAEWAIFEAIATAWDRRPREWPSQVSLARAAGYSERAARDAIASFRQSGIVAVEHEAPDGWKARATLVPGPVTRRELGAIRQRVASRVSAVAGHVSPVAGRTLSAAGLAPPVAAPPRLVAGDHRQPLPLKLNTNNENHLNGPARQPDAQADSPHGQGADFSSLNVTNEDRAVATVAVAECFRHRWPDRAPPRDFDPAAVECVARCAAAAGGDAQSKLQALRDALAGALRSSKQPPTVRYVWGAPRYFRAHLRCGREMRLAREREPSEPSAPVQQPPIVAGESGRTHQGGAEPALVGKLLDEIVFKDPKWRERP
jgi:hypothetical protein